MESIDQDTRRIIISRAYTLKEGEDSSHVDWKNTGFLSFQVYRGSNAWYGNLPVAQYRNDWPELGDQTDLSKFDEVIKLLSPIPKYAIYPAFPTHKLTRYTPRQGASTDIYIKAPKLNQYRANGSYDVAGQLLKEAENNEMVLHTPHTNLNSFLGCIEEDGLLVRLVFPKLRNSLSEYIESGKLKEFTIKQRLEWMEQVEAGATHLHTLGFAHNDISPSNIMFTETGHIKLIDLDACAPLGSRLAKGGYVTGWKGPFGGKSDQYKHSSVDCDKMAIQEIRGYLEEA
ncbi:kinase-like domain-containing protein [Coniella lustricola]|uniref:Kinase-like domain-containing protein n=1 Tax=Coniella lustricola TaxID=2025994 RepID=A0A2T3A7N9_9PEZI|nr:kinase-like domain-containing protein [Coniella lustricola]